MKMNTRIGFNEDEWYIIIKKKMNLLQSGFCIHELIMGNRWVGLWLPNGPSRVKMGQWVPIVCHSTHIQPIIKMDRHTLTHTRCWSIQPTSITPFNVG